MNLFPAARRLMVDGQIRTADVTDSRILAAFGQVPRERFVPADEADLAYLDRDTPVGHGRRLLKPMVLARMIHALAIDAGDRVLDVGAATGYSSAILARLDASVLALEENADLAQAAERTLAALDSANVTVRQGPLTAGWPAEGPYDAILLNGAVERLPDAFTTQLSEGGKLVCVMRRNTAAKVMLYRAGGGELSGRVLFDAAAPLLPGFVAPPEFVF